MIWMTNAIRLHKIAKSTTINKGDICVTCILDLKVSLRVDLKE